jgi:NitT/TauT family transport system substrate-binding protein
LAAVLLFTAGCSSNTAGSQTASDDKSVKIAMVPGSPRAALTIIADRLGYYKEEGVDVKLVNLQTPGDIIGAMEAGKIDQSAFAITPYLASIAKGSNFTIYGGTASQGEALVAKKENVELYKNFANLKGKKIATVRTSTGEILNRPHIKAAGVDFDKDVELVEFTSYPAIVEAIAKGTVDAGYVIVDLQPSYEGRGLANVIDIGVLEPNYVCCRQTATTTALNAKRDSFVKILVANIRAYKFYKENVDKTVDILSEYSGQSRDYIHQLAYVTNANFTVDPNRNGVIKFYNLLKEFNYIKSDVKIEDHIDTSLYRDALKIILEREPNNPIYKQLWTDYEKNNL